MAVNMDKRNFMNHKAVIGLGGNIGPVLQHLIQAILAIKEEVGSVQKVSSIYQTKAWGIEDQPDFLNQVLLVETKLTPSELLTTCLSIEQSLGRDRVNGQHWRERVIDIDILLYEHRIIDLPQLKIPHPYLHKRNFVLIPLNEILPTYVHPILQKSIRNLTEICKDKMEVNPLLI